jgi:hypothetical protein
VVHVAKPERILLNSFQLSSLQTFSAEELIVEAHHLESILQMPPASTRLSLSGEVLYVLDSH